MELLEFYNTTKQYPGGYGIDSINFSVDEGEFVVLTGPSGAGKTTLLKMIYLDEFPDDGEIVIDGISSDKITPRKLVKLRRKIGIIFQDFRLFHDRTVYQNLEFILRVTSCPRNEIRTRITKVLLKVGLQHKAHSNTNKLSGGEKQRVAIARALVNNPKLIIADEPFRNLDIETARDIFNLLHSIYKSGTAIILTTHDPSLVAYKKFRVLKMFDGKLIFDSNKEEKGAI